MKRIITIGREFGAGGGELGRRLARELDIAYTPGEAAVLALQAGCDVLLMPNSLPEAYAAVLEAVQNGTITHERLDQSVNKILRYKEVFTHV